MAHTGSQPPDPRPPAQTPTAGHGTGPSTTPPSPQGSIPGGSLLIGDVIAGALSAVGVTPDRVSSWLGKPCDCKERRAKLNQLELWALRVFGFRKTAAKLDEREKARLAEEARKDLERIAELDKEHPK